MDAYFRLLLVLGTVASLGAGSAHAQFVAKTPNFVVTAPTAEFAKQVGEAAEIYRKELAIEWTGKPLPGNWKYPCPILVTVGTMGAGGKTTFNFQGGEVYGWNMEIQGSEQRILDSVLPHEVNHTIFASHFRRPLPRWADEGAASLIEHDSERNRLRDIHHRVVGSRRKIAIRTLLEMKQYPQDQQDVLTLYAEGHSLADYLVQRGGKPQYIRLMTLAHDKGWDSAFKSLYGITSLDSLERDLDKWVVAGSPALPSSEGTLIASNDRHADGVTLRGQSPDEEHSGDAERAKPVAPPTREAREVTEPEPPRSRDRLEAPLLTIHRVKPDLRKSSSQ